MPSHHFYENKLKNNNQLINGSQFSKANFLPNNNESIDFASNETLPNNNVNIFF